MGDDAGTESLRTEEDVRRIKNACKGLYRKHKVQPGQHWGTLTKIQQARWMEMDCDKFFCQPNKLSGRGVYKCIPTTDVIE